MEPEQGGLVEYEMISAGHQGTPFFSFSPAYEYNTHKRRDSNEVDKDID